jgi:hypothetical protein
MKTTDFRNVSCPYCGHVIEAITDVESNREPRAGDVTICIECSNHALLTADRKLRKPTLEENIAIVENVEAWTMILRAKEAIARIQERNKQKKSFKIML